MTAETPAATATADPSAAPAPTPADPTSAAPSTDAQAAPESTETTATETPAVPEAYTFELPDGMPIDQAAVDKFTPAFKEIGLSQDQASKLVGLYAEHVKGLTEQGSEQFDALYEQRFTADIQKRIEQDGLALKNDPEIGGAKAAAVHKQVSDFIGEFGTPEFKALHDQYGLGNNPEIVRLIKRAIDYTPIDTGEQPAGAGGGAPDDPRARWYPDLVGKK